MTELTPSPAPASVDRQQIRKTILLWSLLALGVVLLAWFGVEGSLIAAAALVTAVATKAFAGLVALITLIPVIGPFLVKILSLPLLWILNGIGGMISFAAFRRGYGKDIARSRLLAWTLIAGLAIGYFLGQLLPL